MLWFGTFRAIPRLDDNDAAAPAQLMNAPGLRALGHRRDRRCCDGLAAMLISSGGSLGPPAHRVKRAWLSPAPVEGRPPSFAPHDGNGHAYLPGTPKPVAVEHDVRRFH